MAATPITCFERARSMARSLPKDEGQRGFLHGLPVLIKDAASRDLFDFFEASNIFGFGRHSFSFSPPSTLGTPVSWRSWGATPK